MATKISAEGGCATRPTWPPVELAKERGALPMFNADLYLSGGTLPLRLPAEVMTRSASTACAPHPLSIAPTARSPGLRRQRSNGITEPPFSHTYTASSGWPMHLQGARGRGTTHGALQAPGR